MPSPHLSSPACLLQQNWSMHAHSYNRLRQGAAQDCTRHAHAASPTHTTHPHSGLFASLSHLVHRPHTPQKPPVAAELHILEIRLPVVPDDSQRRVHRHRQGPDLSGQGCSRWRRCCNGWWRR